MATTTHSDLDGDTLSKLPEKELYEKLKYSDLVRRFQRGDSMDGLWIESGSIYIFNRDKQPFPDHLLAKDSPVAKQAWEVLLSQNRILLDGDFAKADQWLQARHEDGSIGFIRSLEVRYGSETEDCWEQHAKSWHKLAATIRTLTDFTQLDLSLNAGGMYHTYFMMDVDERSLPYVRDMYDEIITSMEGSGSDTQKPKSFFVYWAAFNEIEAEHEKRVMGADYDSEALGKIPASRRNPSFPHGYPYKEHVWSKPMKLRGISP